MLLLIAGLIVFFAIHSVRIVVPASREAWIDKLGVNAWKGIYSIVSLVGLILIVIGYGQARLEPVVLYVPPTGLRHATLLLMLPVFVLLLAAYFPGRISGWVKHPMLVATKLWALSHLLANGTLADVLLFGTFLAWAVADRISVKRRSGGSTSPAIQTGYNDWINVIGGLLLYVAFAKWLHIWLIGVAPIG